MTALMKQAYTMLNTQSSSLKVVRETNYLSTADAALSLFVSDIEIIW